MRVDGIELFRKIILLSHRFAQKRRAKIVLIDSAQGGLGATSLVAGLGEGSLVRRNHTAVLDFDLEGRDLSRYLQTKPYVNENLLMLLERRRPYSEDAVKQCAVAVWHDDNKLQCVPPIPRAEFDHGHLRTMTQVIESLARSYDYILIDGGNTRGALRRALYSLSDRIILMLNNDPANLSPAVNRAVEIMNSKSLGSKLHIVTYSPFKYDLPLAAIKRHFLETTDLASDVWVEAPIPFSSRAHCWPASGRTIYSCGDSRLSNALDGLLTVLEITGAQSSSAVSKRVSVTERLRGYFSGASTQRQHRPSPKLPKGGELAALPAPSVTSLENLVFTERFSDNFAAAPEGRAAAL